MKMVIRNDIWHDDIKYKIIMMKNLITKKMKTIIKLMIMNGNGNSVLCYDSNSNCWVLEFEIIQIFTKNIIPFKSIDIERSIIHVMKLE